VKLALVAVVLLGACDEPGPAELADCGGDLRGVWEAEPGAWHAIVGGDAWELYPMYEERPSQLPAGVRAGPGVIDLYRQPPGAPTLVGTYSRRYELGAARCDVKTAVTLRDCAGDRAVLEVTPPAPPTDYATCAGGGARAAETWAISRSRSRR
jgi:hypothetical protein